MIIKNKGCLLPETRYYKIGEVCKILDIQPHILRYWEKEFPQINPKRISNQRLYSQNDIELITKIKSLLYEKKLTIEGAKKIIGKKKSSPSLFSIFEEEQPEINITKNNTEKDLLKQIRCELIKIKEML